MSKDTKVKEVKEASLRTKQISASAKAIGISFVIGIVLIICGGQIMHLPDFLYELIHGTFMTNVGLDHFLGTLSWMIPLGLALAVSFRIGIFNIGSAGQMLAGGMVAVLFATNVDIPAFGWLICLFFGIIAGMLVSLLIGFLKNEFGVNEVISSIMLNWFVFYILKYFTPTRGFGELLGSNSMHFDWFENILFPNYEASFFTIAIIIALILVPVFWYLYKKTQWGVRQELIGNNRNIGKFLGINEKSEFYKAFAISGALAGLAGAIYVVGFATPSELPAYNISEVPGITFNGITISLLGFNGPVGVLFSSLLMSALANPYLDGTIGSIHIVDIMIAILIVLMAKANYDIYYKVKKTKADTSAQESKPKDDKKEVTPKDKKEKKAGESKPKVQSKPKVSKSKEVNT